MDAASASGALSPVQGETDDDLVLQYQQAVHAFKRDVLDRDGPSASPDATDLSTVPTLTPRRLRLCEAVVALSIGQADRSRMDSAAVAAAAAAAAASGGWGSAAASPLPLAALASSTSTRVSPIVHPLLQPLTRCLCLLADCLLLNELELAVMSLYLDRLCGGWALRLERSHTGSAGPLTDLHNMRVLHYVAYMVRDENYNNDVQEGLRRRGAPLHLHFLLVTRAGAYSCCCPHFFCFSLMLLLPLCSSPTGQAQPRRPAAVRLPARPPADLPDRALPGLRLRLLRVAAREGSHAVANAA
jgi:hypothetical protein